jgi:N-acetylneuraminic acid mutarotase
MKMKIYKCFIVGWFNTDSMNDAGRFHTASVLTNGRVLVISGENDVGTLSSTELYDSLTNTWKMTSNMNYT